MRVDVSLLQFRQKLQHGAKQHSVKQIHFQFQFLVSRDEADEPTALLLLICHGLLLPPLKPSLHRRPMADLRSIEVGSINLYGATPIN